MIRYIPVVIAACIVGGCAPAAYVSKKYSGIDFSGRDLNIAVVGQVNVDYQGSMDNEFPEENRIENITRYIADAVGKQQKESSVFRNISPAALKCDNLKKWNLKWRGEKKLRMALPQEESDFLSDTNVVWLLLQNMKIESKPWVQIIMVSFVPVGAIPHKPLTITADFVYWDPVKKKPIAWGKAMGTSDRGPAVTIENWEAASGQLGRASLKGTPFVKKEK
jgi:hypothetical protein